MKKNKIRCVISGIFYPLTMMGYFIRAFERRNDIDLWTCGPYTGNWIPWKSGMTIPWKYIKTPNFPLPQHAIQITNFDPKIVTAQLPWEPDLWLEIDAGWHFGNKPKAGVVAHILTDPHVLRNHYRQVQDRFDRTFCMQSPYIEGGEYYLPYGFDPEIHYPMELEKEYDACLVGLQYENRNQLVARLREKGLRVFYETGLVYDEYREVYNKSKIALSWSSLNDLPARVWEAMAMKLPLVANQTSDMYKFFVDGIHYWGFANLDEAVEGVMELLKPDRGFRSAMAKSGYNAVQDHSWDHRVEEILKVCELV